MFARVLITVTFFPYLHNHEYFALDRVLLVSVGVCRARARTLTENKHYFKYFMT